MTNYSNMVKCCKYANKIFTNCVAELRDLCLNLFLCVFSSYVLVRNSCFSCFPVFLLLEDVLYQSMLLKERFRIKGSKKKMTGHQKLHDASRVLSYLVMTLRAPSGVTSVAGANK